LRRAILTLGGTAAGIAALLSVKYQPSAAGSALASMPVAPLASASHPAAAPSAGTAAAGKPTKTGKPGATGKPSSSSSTGGGSSSSGTTQSATPRTYTGAVSNTQYGPMQVQITVSGKKITKITVVQETNVGGLSSSIDANAIPQLTSEALSAQSAHINAVSGASYTSAGYAASLQSAIDQAGL
jgi:uncharacterized protein with FMN-binding domain